ncbi:MAG: DUF362 domain-containing protein [Candidatus Aminicenantales bacterium]
MRRREFIVQSAAAIAALQASDLLSLQLQSQEHSLPNICVAKGNSLSGLAEKALQPFGGMKNFVKRGDRVVILPNPQGNRPGVSTSASLVGEVVRLCLEAGAAEAVVASIHSPGRWFGTGIIQAVEEAGGKMHYPRSAKDWIEVSLPEAKRLKKATIIRKSRENDAFIDLPIVKQHDSTRITAGLKNLMGFNLDNQFFHRGEEVLHQSIADLATLFSPRLIIVDAFTILTENGPFGPGRTVSPQRVVAGTDIVAVDAYCCRFLGLKPEDIRHIQFAHEMGLGNKDLSGKKIIEVNGTTRDQLGWPQARPSVSVLSTASQSGGDSK